MSSGVDTAAQRIKKQALQGIDPQIEQFYFRLKHQYFMPLLQAVARDVTDKIHDRFSRYKSLDTRLAGNSALDRTKIQTQQKKVTDIVSQLQQIRRDILGR